ncbi:MAG: CBS domain-containing protein [Bacteroidia bacterium]|nr:CBS domain-containing protein [Bacteroidia bacterium]
MDTVDLLRIKVKEAMSPDVISSRPETLITELITLVESYQLHHIPVTDHEGNLKGIISKLDLAPFMPSLWRDNDKIEKAAVDATGIKAEDLMNMNVVIVGPNDPLEKCIGLLRENFFRALPVVDNQKLMGIITTYDLVNIAYRRTPFLT